jgi:hypothetical protein
MRTSRAAAFPPRATLGAILVFLALLASCAKKASSNDEGPGAADAGTVVDLDVMAFLSEARALHHQANIKEDDRDIEGAISVMKHLVTAPQPHPGQKVPEVEEVLADAWARIAELELKRHGLEDASKAVTEGLARAPEPTYFRGHLLEVQGIIEESRAADLADAGRKEEAAKAREHAIALLQDAVSVQEKVIGRALAERGGGDASRPDAR